MHGKTIKIYNISGKKVLDYGNFCLPKERKREREEIQGLNQNEM
jgi:hypothetical protein